MLVLRALTVDDWAAWRALKLAALREAPYAFEARLADWQGENDTEPRWRRRLDGGSLNLLAELDGEPAGMASGMTPDRDGTVHLLSLWVAPFARGRGVGDALVAAVVRWAEGRRAGRVALRVAEGNHRARALYRRNGFSDRGLAGTEREMVRETGVS
jgi:ribosomal protein S18 acetylase RimI-like enzyme